MLKRRIRVTATCITLSLGLPLASCDDGSGVIAVESDRATSNDDDDCTPGEVRCDCLSDGSCDPGLECRSELCVVDEGADDEADDDGEVPGSGADDAEAEPSAGGNPTMNVAGAPGEPEPTTPAEPEPVAEPEPNVDGSGGTGNDGTPMGGSGGETDGTGGSAGMPNGGAAGGGGTPSGQAGMANTTFDDGLLSNGDFSQGNTGWNLTDGADGPVSNYDTASGAMCVTLDSNGYYVTIGWPPEGTPGVVLDGASYELSFDARADDPGGVIFEAKVGEAVSPYSDHVRQEFGITSTLANYSLTFSPLSSEPSGVVFFVELLSSSSVVCIDNVALHAL